MQYTAKVNQFLVNIELTFDEHPTADDLRKAAADEWNKIIDRPGRFTDAYCVRDNNFIVTIKFEEE